MHCLSGVFQHKKIYIFLNRVLLGHVNMNLHSSSGSLPKHAADNNRYIHLSLQGIRSGIAVKNQPVMQEMQKTQAQSLGFEDPMRLEMATHSSILAWKIPWTEHPMGSQRVVSN